MRMRTVRPEFFVDEDLVTHDPMTRLLFVGLWCVADREGRLEDRPSRIKMQILPVDDCDVDLMLSNLARTRHITRYTMDDRKYIHVRNFKKYQRPHTNESASILPPPPAVPCNVSAENDHGGTHVVRSDVFMENGDGGDQPPPGIETAHLPSCLDRECEMGPDPDSARKATLSAHLLGRAEKEWGTKWAMNGVQRNAFIAAFAKGCLPDCDGSYAEDCVLHVWDKLHRLGNGNFHRGKHVLEALEKDREEVRCKR